MVKTSSVYSCEICKEKYSKKSEAVACEKSGFDYPEIPVGSVFQLSSHDDDDIRKSLTLKQLFHSISLDNFLITLHSEVQWYNGHHIRAYDFLRLSANILTKKVSESDASGFDKTYFGLPYLESGEFFKYAKSATIRSIYDEDLELLKKGIEHLLTGKGPKKIYDVEWINHNPNGSMKFPNKFLPSSKILKNPQLFNHSGVIGLLRVPYQS